MIEHELRFELTPSMAAEFEQRASIGLTQPSARLCSRYFDTAAGDLTDASVSLRVRKTAEGYVQRAKVASAFEHREWEAAVAGEHPVLDALPPQDHPVGALARECFGLLVPVFETDFERQVRLVRPQPGVRVELACDRGEIRAGRRSERIAEVRLERKEGSAAAFYHYAMQWARLHQAQLVLASKSLRGLQLAGWQPRQPQPRQFEPAAPAADLPMVAAARQILTAHLEHLVGSIAPVTARGDSEGPHQLRVALRRFRSAIRFLELHRPQLPADGSPADSDASGTWQSLDHGARALAEAASFVRDADLMETGLLAGLREAFPADEALQVLGRALAGERERARARLRETVASSGLATFVVQALAAIESLPEQRWPDMAFGDFAAKRLARIVRQLRRRAKRARTVEQWHGVRIAARNLRYALAGCRGLGLTTMPVGEAIAALSAWQEALGLEQDLAVARSVAAQALAHSAAPAESTVRAAALIDGYRAFAARSNDPDKLRDPILALSKRLLAAPGGPDGPCSLGGRGAPGIGSRSAQRAGPQAARPPTSTAAPGSVRRSGYHSGTPAATVPAAPETAPPHVETCKEEPE